MVASPHRGPSCTPRGWGWVDGCSWTRIWAVLGASLCEAQPALIGTFPCHCTLHAPWEPVGFASPACVEPFSQPFASWGTRRLRTQGSTPSQCFPTMESLWNCLPLPFLPTGKHPPAAVPAGEELQGGKSLPLPYFAQGEQGSGSVLPAADGWVGCMKLKFPIPQDSSVWIAELRG